MSIHHLLNHDIVCDCGKVHRCDISSVIICQGAIDQLPQAVEKYNHILLVADNNTYPLCGDRVKQVLKGKVENCHVFQTEGFLVPNEQSSKTVDDLVTDKTDLVLGIGSGVINDICKYVAFFRKIKSGIVATAPSMDGYASSGAAMILGGMKVTVTTSAPDLIIGDVDVLKNAPMDMIGAGYGDIIGKYSSLNDWKLSHLINGEHFCPAIYKITLDATNEIRSLANEIINREPYAIGKLMETLCATGICLTLAGYTRPGSGSEHHLSHFFEITGLIEDKPYFLHGTDVGYSTIITAEIREKIRTVKTPIFHKITDEQRKACYKKIYKNYDKEVWDIQEKEGRYKTDVSKKYIENWDKVKEILAECPTADQFRDMLKDFGFEFYKLEQMYGEEKIRNSAFFGKDLKDRYTVLWLYCDLFLTDAEIKRTLN